MKSLYYGILLIGWVLWIRTQGPAVDDWSGLSGFTTEEQCLANLKEKMDTWKQFKDAKFAKNAVTFTGNNTTMTYQCLIDSEDPRKAPPKRVR
ncbi:MAG: hypothetical protein ACM37Z_19175 [Deltaproteobacteria bacterium]